jgi:membrane protein
MAAVVITVAASRGLALYARHWTSFNAVYGSLGAIVLLSLWFYVSGVALVLGAELNAWLDRRARRPGSRSAAPERLVPSRA